MSKRKTDEELALITALAKIRKELATKGIDFDSDNGKLSYSEMLELYKEIRMKELNEKLEAADKEFDDDEEKEEAILERIKVQDQANIPKVMKITTKSTENKEVNVKSKKRKKTWLKIASGVIAGGLVLTGVATLSAKVGEELYYSHVKREKMSPYEALIDKAVTRSTHEMWKTRDVGAGEKEQFCEYYIDYKDIAEAINHSDNPDLALYTLYNYYGKSKASIYEGITSKTCEFLTFDENGIEKKGDLYDYASGFNKGDKTDEEILEAYDKACDAELKYGDDSILDNMTIKVIDNRKSEDNKKLKKTLIEVNPVLDTLKK